MKTRKEQQQQNQGIEQDVIGLGFVANVANKVSANELAASGIQLSVRDKLLAELKNLEGDKSSPKDENAVNILEGPQKQQITSKPIEKVVKFANIDKQKFEIE